MTLITLAALLIYGLASCPKRDRGRRPRCTDGALDRCPWCGGRGVLPFDRARALHSPPAATLSGGAHE